jgi:CobQ-like glutamine amidotransferase family enzyme
MIIEILYSDAGMLFGDRGNVSYIQRVFPNATFIFTQYPQKPYFLKESVDMVIIGAMSESWQLRIIELLTPYQTRIIDLIADDVFFLVTANALDLFGKSIEDEKGVIHPALDIFDFSVKIHPMKRLNTQILGTFNGITMVGFKTQFNEAFGDNQKHYFIDIEQGFGLNLQSVFEGIHFNNFFGTHCIGPLLPLNPPFAKYLLEKMAKKPVVLPFYQDMLNAYHQRIEEFKSKKQ